MLLQEARLTICSGFVVITITTWSYQLHLSFFHSIGIRHCERGRPDDELLREIGAAIASHEQCVKLALKLQLGDDDFYKLVEATFTEELAYDILKKWVKTHSENANGSVLHAALCDAERQDLADRFERRLLATGRTMSICCLI